MKLWKIRGITVKLKCECCGFEREFEDREEAFEEGWDAPPHFSQFVTCELCPSAPLVLGHKEEHDKAHARWEREGRPATFTESMEKGDVVKPPGYDELVKKLEQITGKKMQP